MSRRLRELRDRLEAYQLHYFLVTAPHNLRYLCGFTGSNGAALVTPEKLYFITDPRYEIQAAVEVQAAEVLLATEDLFRPVRERGLLPKAERFGFEAHHLTFRQFSTLRNLFPHNRLTATEHIVERIASRKEEAEIDRIRKANEVCAAAFQDVLTKIRVGSDCFELAAELSYQMKRRGGTADAFEPIVASGPRAALPHAHATHQKIQPNDFLLLDFGCFVDGYAADTTRTVVVGAPTSKQKEMYAAVLGANRLSIEAIVPGMKAADLDRTARTFFEQRGLDKLFIHSLGHGIGLRVHDLPRVSKRSKDVLEPGNVITIEPGLYEAGYGGVRIEDDVVVRESGAEILTTIPKELVHVG